MADDTVDLPKYRAPVGKLLTLTSSEALEVGYSKGTVSSFEELLKKTNLANAKVIETEETFYGIACTIYYASDYCADFIIDCKFRINC